MPTTRPARVRATTAASPRDTDRRLSALLRFGWQVNAELELKRLPGLIARRVVDATGWPAAATVLCDPKLGPVELIEASGMGRAFADAWRRAAEQNGGQTELARARRTRRPASYPDVAAEPGLATRAAILGAGMRRAIAVPLIARGQVLGLVVAYDRRPGRPARAEVELLRALARPAAGAIQNARLYGELQVRLEEMVGLQRLGTLLLEEHDFERVLQAICQQLRRLTDAGGVGLALLEPGESRHLELRTVVGPSAAALRGARIPIDGSFAGEAIRANQPQRSDDAPNDPRGYRRSLLLGNTRTILSVPMKTRQRTVGVLSIYNKQGEDGFTERDAELATFFATQAAAAIENARLYEQTREYAVIEERNRLARELHDSITHSLFSVTLLSQAALNLWGRDGPKARERLERAHEVAQGALAEMRALIFQLRPTALQEEGLLSALRKHLAALHSRDGLSAELHVAGAERRLPASVEEAAFRILQESLNNVAKHARVSAARVEVEFGPELVRICTADEGVGFNPAARPKGRTLGMASMRERAEGVGGCLRVKSAPGRGTRVCAKLPVGSGER